MRRNKPVSIVIAAALLTAMMIVSAATAHPQTKNAGAIEAAATAAPDEPQPSVAPDDMRGVWVTYMELSMEYESDKSEAAFRKKFEAIASDCKSRGFNTLFVQVRPFCDALYDSKLFPASHVLSGEQGKSMGYDALRIMCAVCRAQGLSLHAWVNPYRVTANGTPAELSANNPYKRDKTLGIVTESGVILDPSREEARKLIVDGVKEITDNYDVDGVQFDDYFYPEDMGSEDSASYQAYLQTAPQGGAMDLAAWRCANVNLLLSEVYLAVHRSKPGAVFGVSPQGNLENNYELNADVISWCCKRGFADYICPQLYFSLENPSLGFKEALAQWTTLNFSNSVKLYAGLAGYKAGSDADGGTWLSRTDNLAEELNILQENKKVSGFLLYSYTSLTEEKSEEEIKRAFG